MIADLFINIVMPFAQLCNSLELNYISSLFKYCNLSADFLHFAAEKNDKFVFLVDLFVDLFLCVVLLYRSGSRPTFAVHSS